MSKFVCGLYDLSTKKSGQTKGKARWNVKFNSAYALTYWTRNSTHDCTKYIYILYTVVLPEMLHAI